MSKRRNVLAALLLLSVTACSAQATVDSPQSTVLKVGDQKGNAQSLLTAAGLLGDLPYKIEWSTFTSGPPLLEAASAGAIDLGGVGNTPPIFAAAANAKIAAVSVAKGNVASDAILVSRDSLLRQVVDLRGKTIAVAKGSSAHGQVLNTLRVASLSTKDVKLSFLQPSDAYAAFTQKRVDAWAVWDPYTAQAEIEAGARVLTDGAATANGYSFQVASTTSLKDNGKSAAIKDYLQRIAKAQRWADTHHEEWAQAYAKETGLTIAVTRVSVKRGADLPVPLDDKVITSEQQLADAFHEDGTLPARVDFAKFVDAKFQADIHGGTR